MNNQHFYEIHKLAAVWAEQLKTEPSFTDTDVEELKGHLIDLAEELRRNGLNEDEAFKVASSRLGVNSALQKEFKEINLPVIQLRNTILVLSGILLFFLLYFFMICSTRLLVLVLHDPIEDPYLRIRLVVSYVIVYQLFFIIATLFLYFSGEKMIKKLQILKIKPRHTFFLFTGVIILALANHWLYQLINEVFGSGLYTSISLYITFDYSAYTYPLILIICFVVLFKKHYSSFAFTGTTSVISRELDSLPGGTSIELSVDAAADVTLRDKLELHLKELEKIPLSKEETLDVAWMRLGMNSLKSSNTADRSGSSMRNLMIILSGVLTYFLLYYLMISSARVLFSGLQYLEKDVALNIRRTWLFVISFQSLFVFFTAGLYFSDKNIVYWLNRLHIKPVHTRWLLVATIFFATVDRSFFPISKNLIRMDRGDLEFKFYDIFIVSKYTFPFILGACLLVLFYKYYRDHVRIGD